jgi:hypothetical protein
MAALPGSAPTANPRNQRPVTATVHVFVPKSPWGQSIRMVKSSMKAMQETTQRP